MMKADKRPRLHLITLGLLAFGTCGFATVVANLSGLARRSGGLVPVVDDVQGLMSTTLILLGLGALFALSRSLFHILRMRKAK